MDAEIQALGAKITELEAFAIAKEAEAREARKQRTALKEELAAKLQSAKTAAVVSAEKTASDHAAHAHKHAEAAHTIIDGFVKETRSVVDSLATEMGGLRTEIAAHRAEVGAIIEQIREAVMQRAADTEGETNDDA